MHGSADDLFVHPTVPVPTLHRTYAAHCYSEDDAGYVRGGAIDTFHFENAVLYVGDLPVLEPYIGVDFVTWQQQTAGRYTSGHLFFSHGGAAVHGVAALGTSAQDAQLHHVFAAAVPDVVYRTQLSTTRFPLGTQPDHVPSGDWADGLELKIGVRQDIGDVIPRIKVYLAGEELSPFDYTFSVTADTTILNLHLDASIVCTFDDFYLTGKAVFPVLVPTPGFSGEIVTRCSNMTGGGAWVWKGEPVDATSAGIPRRPPLAIGAADTQPLDAGLSVAELMTLIPDANVGNLANGMLVENMKWAMGQDRVEHEWLSTFFGERTPVLPPQRQDLVRLSMGWYQQDFTKSYLGWAIANYSGPNASTVTLSAAQSLKLQNHLQTGLGRTKDYTIQQNGIYLDAYVATKSRLRAYIDDGGEKWAQALFEVLVSPAQFVLILARVFGAPGLEGALTPANNFATILTALQPSGKLAGEYMNAVLTGTVTQLAQRSTVNEETQIMEWLPDWLNQFLQKIATDHNVPDAARLAAEQLKGLLSQMGGNMIDVAKELASFVVAAGGEEILKKTQFAESAFAKKWPQFARVGKMLFFAMWSTGLVMSIQAFLNWGALTPEQRFEAVSLAILISFQGLEIVPEMILGIKEMGLGGWRKFQDFLSRRATYGNVRNLLARFTPQWAERGATETTALFNKVTRTIDTQRSLFRRVFTFAGKVVAVVGVVVSAVFAASSTVNFINAVREGQPITNILFDGILAATGIATTVCLVIDLLVVTTIFAWAAAILAIVGVVVTIVMMFYFKPESPLTLFMREVIVPFVNGLPDPGDPPLPAFFVPRFA
jgi:hypothetical protein